MSDVDVSNCLRMPNFRWYMFYIAIKFTPQHHAKIQLIILITSHSLQNFSIHVADLKTICSLCCVISSPYRFLRVTRCLEYLCAGQNRCLAVCTAAGAYLSSGENRAGCALWQGISTGIPSTSHDNVAHPGAESMRCREELTIL